MSQSLKRDRFRPCPPKGAIAKLPPPSLQANTVPPCPGGNGCTESCATSVAQQGTATANQDFTTTSGTLSFPAGVQLATVSVPILPDLLPEPDETFSLVLSSPTNATITDNTGVGTIIDDDAALNFHTVTPCRFIDSRTVSQPLAANTYIMVSEGGACGVPVTARALVLNISAVSPTDGGHLRLYPGGTPPPLTSALNVASGKTRSGNAIATLGENGSVTIGCYMPTGATHIVLDVFGYFE
jgi:hypothetical protein